LLLAMAQLRENDGQAGPRIITVTGLKRSGKTTVAAALIAELKRRGHRVGSIKSTHHAALAIDLAGTDTRRHLEAGAEAVVALAAEETVLFQRPGPCRRIEDAMRLLPPGIQYVVCEGLPSNFVPLHVVLCLLALKDYEEAIRVRGIAARSVIAISGIAAGTHREAAGLGAVPVLNALDPGELRRLADLVVDATA